VIYIDIMRDRYSFKITSGFTLIELMVVVALLAIVTTIAIPSWNRLVTSNRIRAAVNDWTSSVQFARSEALRQNSPVTLCPSSDGLNCTASDYEVGWIVKTGLPAAAGVILQDALPKQQINMTVAVSARRNLTFLPNGLPIGNFAGNRIVVTDLAVTDITLRRYICIARTARVRVLNDTQYTALPPGDCG
jgi:type IV fimbrial biogenesis protein FimT